MNRLILSVFIFSSILLVSLTSCSKDEQDIEDNVFIEDEDFPGLPIYSEWGYNSFGVLIDREAFASSTTGVASKVIVKSDTLYLTLKGRYKGKQTTLQFAFPDSHQTLHEELLALNNQQYDLSNSSECVVYLDINNSEAKKLNILEGTLHFKKVQKLLVDKKFSHVAMSGEFRFKTFLYDEPIAFNYGRFDLGIGYNNFFNINVN